MHGNMFKVRRKKNVTCSSGYYISKHMQAMLYLFNQNSKVKDCGSPLSLPVVCVSWILIMRREDRRQKASY